MAHQVLLIEDDEALRTALAQTLELAGLTPLAMPGLTQARRAIRANFAGVILSDIRMPDRDGFSVLSLAVETDPELPVILMTGHSDVPTALKAMKAGAYDYLEKPCNAERLVEVLTRALRHREVVLKSRRIEQALLRNDAAAVHFPGAGAVSRGLRRALRQVAASGRHVHLHGPDGVGKKQAAYVINRIAPEPRPLRRLNFRVVADGAIAALDLPEGPFDLSAKNVDAAGPDAQRDLLALLSRRPDLRLLTTATRPLGALDGHVLAEDLSPGEQVVELRVPDLNERREDLPEIFESLVRLAVRNLDGDMPDISADLIADLRLRPWQGNLPELRAHAAALALGGQSRAAQGPGRSLGEQIDAFERLVLIDSLKRCGGRAAEAAALLGVPRNTLYDRLARHGLSARDFRDGSTE